MAVKIRDLAAELGVSKPTVLRYVKSYLNVEPEQGKTLYLTDKQASIIAAVIQKRPLEQSDKLNSVAVDVEVAVLQERISGLEEKIRLLEDKNTLLEERLKVADAALERQQKISGGFWNRLGQKLLGSGKTR